MTDRQTTYTFKIEGFQPETMPFGRLVEYYAQLQKMLDANEGVHLVAINEGSHANQFAIEDRFHSGINKRIMAINAGTAPKSAKNARDNINAMLSDDKASGVFISDRGNNVVQFPGFKKQEAAIVSLRDSASFTGSLYSLAMVSGDIKLRLNSREGDTIYCTTTRELATELRAHLFEDMRVSGRGLWSKGSTGKWEISDFHVTDFTPLNKQSLRDTVDAIRSLDIDWPEDPLAAISFASENGGPQ